MFTELKRLVYQVEDVEAARDWYGRVLGCEPAFDSPVACIPRYGSVGQSPTAPTRMLARATARRASCCEKCGLARLRIKTLTWRWRC
jgi:hypothetical protein